MAEFSISTFSYPDEIFLRKEQRTDKQTIPFSFSDVEVGFVAGFMIARERARLNASKRERATVNRIPATLSQPRLLSNTCMHQKLHLQAVCSKELACMCVLACKIQTLLLFLSRLIRGVFQGNNFSSGYFYCFF